MSTLRDARDALAAAINSITGMRYFDKTPAAPRAGDTWLRWKADRADEGVGFDVSWMIVVVTPQGEAAADAWIDEHIDDLLAALRPVTYVTAYGPANVSPTDGSPVDGLLITTNRE